MQREDAKPVATAQRANRKTRSLGEWLALRKYQYTVVTGTGEYGPGTAFDTAASTACASDGSRSAHSDARLARDRGAARCDGWGSVFVLLFGFVSWL